MNFDKKLKFDNKGKAVFSKQNDNGETIQYEVTDISKQLGPGTWNVIHTMSFYCKTEDQQSCAQFIKMIIYKYPCESCRKHAISYLKYNPMKINPLYKEHPKPKCIKTVHFLYRKRTQSGNGNAQQLARQSLTNWHVFASKGPRDSNL